MRYQEAWQFLDELQFFKIKLGLDSMARFLELLGNPQQALQAIHIAGTNGKGSVAATLLAILSQAGFKVGLYTSPHLTSVRERFRINGSYIDQDAFTRNAQKIIEVLGAEQITYFEFTTALAFLWFAEQEVDLALIEVGMGGRLDATNVLRPLVSVITNVSMDHEAYLGDKLALVAAEKAGIIKNGVPVVCGDLHPEARAIISRQAELAPADLFLAGRDFSWRQETEQKWRFRGGGLPGKSQHEGLTIALRGEHQLANTAVALAVLDFLPRHGFDISPQEIGAGLMKVCWPGRLESFGAAFENGAPRSYLLDGAHNPAGVEALVTALQQDFQFDKLILVWAAMSDKALKVCLNLMAPLSHVLIFTRPDDNRSATASQLKAQLAVAHHGKCLARPEVAEALRTAASMAGPNDLICIAGSLYLVGKARALLLGELVDD